MEFIETSIFTKLIYTYLSDDEYLGLQVFLLKHPEAGNIVPGSGGVRKLRWAMAGIGAYPAPNRGGAQLCLNATLA